MLNREKAKYTATVKLNGGSYNGSTNDFTISKYPGEEISIGHLQEVNIILPVIN